MATSKNKSELFSESAENERERKLQRRRERERARRASEYKEKKDWQRGESETGPDELLKQWSKGKHVCNVDAIG